MTITDAFCESIETILDEAIRVYDADEMMQVAEDQDIVEIIALCLKIIHRRGYLKKDRVNNNIDWIAEAKNKIIAYIEEHYKE